MNIELLQRIRQHILEKPNRFLMGDWIVRDNGIGVFSDDREEEIPFAECGTAACVAGWACLLGGKRDTLSPSSDGRHLLGLTWDQSENLFFEDQWPDPFHRRYRSANSHEEQVQIAADRIEHFIKTGE